MARMRTVKPEFWTSAQIVECSPIARLLFIGIWNFCDDAGIHPFNTKRLKMEVFPADDFTAEQIGQMVDELIQVGLLMDYEAEGKQWLMVTGWSHQRIDKPTYKHPKPNSTSPRRVFDEPSPPDRKGEEGNRKGEESKIPPNPPSGGTSEKKKKRSPVTVDLLTFPPSLDTPDCRTAAGEWLDYKKSRGQSYKNPSHLNKLLEEFSRDGPQVFCEAVNHSIARNYQGIFRPGGQSGVRSGGSTEQRQLTELERAIAKAEQEERDAGIAGPPLRGLPGFPG